MSDGRRQREDVRRLKTEELYFKALFSLSGLLRKWTEGGGPKRVQFNELPPLHEGETPVEYLGNKCYTGAKVAKKYDIDKYLVV